MSNNLRGQLVKMLDDPYMADQILKLIDEALPKEEEICDIINCVAVEYNHTQKTPDFIWKCSIEELARACLSEMRRMYVA